MDGKSNFDLSGRAVCMPDANTVAIGAYGNDDNGTDAGQVRVFTICNQSTSTISPTECKDYTSPSGKYTYASTGTYLDTISNATGCDSIITILLTVNKIDKSVMNASPILTAKEINARYQWVDCSNNYAFIPGATKQSFVATADGKYAVTINKNACTDTSECQLVIIADVSENGFGKELVMYPNPTTGNLTIDLGNTYTNVQFLLRNLQGQEIMNKEYGSSTQIQAIIESAPGMYMAEIRSDHKIAVMRVLLK